MERQKGWLKAERELTSLSQHDVRIALGVGRSSFSDKENGLPRISRKKLASLRRLLLLPRFRWEPADPNVSCDTLPYEARERIARAKADSPAVKHAMIAGVVNGFFRAIRGGKAHLFVFCFQEFLDKIEAVLDPEASPPAEKTLRDILLHAHKEQLMSSVGLLQIEASKLADQAVNRMTTTRRLKIEERRQGVLKKAEEIERRASSSKVSDRELMAVFKSLGAIGLPDGTCAVYRPDTDLDEKLRPPKPGKPALESFWEETFAEIDADPGPDVCSWGEDDDRSGFSPEVSARISKSEPGGERVVTYAIRLLPGEGRILYANGFDLPLEREAFGRARAAKTGLGFDCVVKFRAGQTSRFVQFVLVDRYGDWNRSRLFEAFPNGSLKEIPPFLAVDRGNSKLKNAVSKTVSNRAGKGRRKQPRAASKHAVDKLIDML